MRGFYQIYLALNGASESRAQTKRASTTGFKEHLALRRAKDAHFVPRENIMENIDSKSLAHRYSQDHGRGQNEETPVLFDSSPNTTFLNANVLRH